MEFSMIKKVITILEYILAVLVFILAFAVLFQIPARMLFHIPATWTTEVGRSAFTAIVFIGLPLLLLDGTLMRIEFIRESIKNRTVAMIVDTICDILTFFFEITLIYGCFNRTMTEWSVTIPSVEFLTYGYVYLIMSIGSVLMLFASIIVTVTRIRNKGEVK